MSTKFVSKSSNLMVVLRSGVEGNRAIGTQAKPGLYARFQGGIIEVKDDTMIQLLREHPACGSDFIEIAEKEVDPFEYNRNETEPVHVMHEMKYGHIEKMKGVETRPLKLSPEMKNLIESEAIKMLPLLLKSNPGILKKILTELVASEEAKNIASDDVEISSVFKEEVPVVAKRGPGRPSTKQ